MASGPAANPPPSSPSTLPLPLLVQPPPEDDHEIIDLDRPLSRSSNGGSSHWNDLDDLYPSRDRAFLSPDEATSPRRPFSRMSESSIPDVAVSAASPNTTPSPFNFQTQFISTSPVKSTIGQRRGHKYKHSSISSQHQIIKEPPRRAPPVLPASLPVPTLREAWTSMRKDQRARLYWCICHGLIAAYVFFSAGESLALTALSHLVFFDVGSAAICMGVDVLGNFEVWKRSSIRHPFGLQRAEVLAGFALSVFLVFGGFDLLSHNLKHILESVGSHAPHYPHEHSHAHGPDHVISAGEIDTASLAAALSTLVSAYGLKNHARIRRVMQPSYLSTFLPEILANPFHSLTLFFSFLMLLLPLLSVTSFVWLDRLICVAIAVSMFILGSRLAIAQGLMLLMSYNGRTHENETTTTTTATTTHPSSSSSTNPIDKNTATDSVVREIESEPAVSRVEEAQFWQVHYGLCMATVKLCVIRGCDDAALSQLRQRIGRIVQNRLGGEGYGKGGPLKWEITLQMTTDSA